MSLLPPPSTAPAGWYPDPLGGGPRYFDGRHWAATGPTFDPVEEHPDLPMVTAVGALAVLVVSLVASKFVVDALVDRDWPLAAYVALAATIAYLPSVIWGMVVRRRWGASRLASIGFRFRWSDLGWGPLTWLAAMLVELLLMALVIAFDVPFESNVVGGGDVDPDRAYKISFAITAVVAAPLVEELIFRGVVLRGFLSRMGPVLAIALQGVLFGVAHIDPVRGNGNVGLALVLSGTGIAFGAAAYLLHRLGPTIIAHAIFNGVVLLVLLLS